MNSITLTDTALHLKFGLYEHYKKGTLYRVLGVAIHSETLEELVVYQQAYDEKLMWVRPLSMFTEEISINGELIPRFRFVGQDSSVSE